MYEEEALRVREFADRLSGLRKALNVEALKGQVAQLEGEMAEPGFWDDPDSAQKVIQRLKGIKTVIAAPEELHREIEDVGVFVELAQGEEDESLGGE